MKRVNASASAPPDLTDLQRMAVTLDTRMPAGQPYALAVVSPRTGDGRTHMSAWLAVAFAVMGRSCILVDGDLRRPAVHTVFDLPLSPGVADMLSGTVEVGCGHVMSGPGDLRVVTAGTVNPALPDPVSLWNPPVAGALFARWRAEADVVIIDTPGALRHTDAQVIASQTEGCVLVGREGVSPLVELAATRDLMQAAGAQVMGCLYNRFGRRLTLREYFAWHAPRVD